MQNKAAGSIGWSAVQRTDFGLLTCPALLAREESSAVTQAGKLIAVAVCSLGCSGAVGSLACDVGLQGVLGARSSLCLSLWPAPASSSPCCCPLSAAGSSCFPAPVTSACKPAGHSCLTACTCLSPPCTVHMHRSNSAAVIQTNALGQQVSPSAQCAGPPPYACMHTKRSCRAPGVPSASPSRARCRRAATRARRP